ncbi:spermidine synthase [Agromyces sp. SYSU T00194]|uniref:spermidine synthase n=1 Tax=Agromyces chitinivorans TaxID=3158560 RepID=UPI00339B6D86
MTDPHVRVEPSPVYPGALELIVDDRPQSVVDPSRPVRLHYDYAHRVGAVLAVAAPPGAPLRVLHIGGGAMTLARHVAVTRPGSRQLVVEADPEVVRAVGERMPLDAISARSVRVRVGDAADVLTTLDGPFDVAIVDAYVGLDAPAFATSSRWYRRLRALVPDGVIVANVVDDGDLGRVRAVAPVLAGATGGLVALGPRDVLDGTAGGNVVLVGGDAERIATWLDALRQAGPHPATVLGPDEASAALLA